MGKKVLFTKLGIDFFFKYYLLNKRLDIIAISTILLWYGKDAC